jgi:hypothetical protein
MATTTNYGWTTPDNTALVKDGASAIRTLGSSVDTSLKSLSPGTTAGDVDYYTSSTAKARLGIGTTGQVLTVAGGVPSWANASASGGLTLISETTASALASLSLSSIPSTYKQLFVVWQGIYHSASGNRFDLRFNADSAANYSANVAILSSGSSNNFVSDTQTSTTSSNTLYAPFGASVTAVSSTNYSQMNSGWMQIDNYSSTSKFKNVSGQWVSWDGFDYHQVMQYAGVYKSTTAITSLDIVRTTGAGTFSNATSTSIRLYGLS